MELRDKSVSFILMRIRHVLNIESIWYEVYQIFHFEKKII